MSSVKEVGGILEVECFKMCGDLAVTTKNVLENAPSLSLYLDDIEREEFNALRSMGASERKKQGVFFTPSDLANLAVSKINFCRKNDIVLDPSCGTGNLLLEIAADFEVDRSLHASLVRWNKKIHGLDINPKFVEIAKKKMIHLAISKGAIPEPGITLATAMSLLSNIRVGDFLSEYTSYRGVVNSIVMNPPFCPLDTPPTIAWTSGKSNAAALFMFYAVEILPDGGKILGVLPDVLKSGSRYAAWRTSIYKTITPTIMDFGSFQPGVQVDVFILTSLKASSISSIDRADYPALQHTQSVLADRYNVSVGPVVPHRDIFIGIDSPFAHAKILPAWATVDKLAERVAHSGRKITPPFVAVRRTSSPKDKYRVVGTIVNCNEQVAVENHIIAICPKDGSLESCQRLLGFLKASVVNDYINSKIRCRHLTVGVIKGIPIGSIDEHKE